MENLKKKIKLNFPYKIFDIESRSKSQISLIRRSNRHQCTSPMNRSDKLNIYDYTKKLKSTILSSKIFSHYMANYLRQTQDYSFKSPSNTFYPIKKNFYLLPLHKRSNANNDDNKENDVNNKMNSVMERPYGYKYKKTKIIINNKKRLSRSTSEKLKAKIFMSFIEGDHYHKILMKTFGLKNIDISNSQKVMKDNYNYLKKCFKDLNSVENFESEKEFEFNIGSDYKRKEIIFNLKIFSMSFNFYEITEGKEKNINKIVNKKKLYFPFKLLPLFYLLDFSDFKNLLSEIIYYDTENDAMNFQQSNIKQTIKKYIQYIKNNFMQKDKQYFDNISFHKNEFIYQRNYDWIICDQDKDVKKPKYKMKISFPKVLFEKKSDKIKIIHRMNKSVIIQILKNNFMNWENLVLFDLFSNKKFRFIINNILIGGKKYEKCTINLFENILNISFEEHNTISNSYEFFITEAIKKKSYYYIFNPNIILILLGDKIKTFQKIELSFKDSKILYEISKYWGIINTLLRCMYKDEEKNKIYFKINILNDLPKFLYRKIHYNINSLSKEAGHVNNKKKFIEYKTKDIELLMTECLLKIINITKNERNYSYYKVPKELYKTILSSNDTIKIINSIQNNFNEIISNAKEVNIQNEEERMLGKINSTENYYERIKLSKKPTFRGIKSTPIQNFNKIQTLGIKNPSSKEMFTSDKIISLTKKNSALKVNKILDTKKNSNQRKTVKLPKNLNTKNSTGDININENMKKLKEMSIDRFQETSNKNDNENIKEDLNRINSIEQFKKYKYSKQYSIDFINKNS